MSVSVELSYREQLARSIRILANAGVMDPWGHASSRVPGSKLVATSPRFVGPLTPRYVSAEDLLLVTPSGEIVDGTGELPQQFGFDLALYEARPAINACVFSAPKTTLAFGVTRRTIRPYLHTGADFIGDIGWIESGELLDRDSDLDAAIRALDSVPAAHQPGVGYWSVGPDITAATTLPLVTECHAQANLAAQWFHPEPRPFTEEEIAALYAETSDVRLITQADHYRLFFAEMDDHPRAHPWASLASEAADLDPAEMTKAKIAFSCRILWERKTLVTYFEHVSHRLPGGRWLMSEAKPFNRMGRADVSTLDGEANWISGPVPPPFKCFHAEIFEARPDVTAIVHTHDVVGRLSALAGYSPQGAFRHGLRFVDEDMPVYGVVSRIFAPDRRAEAIDTLGERSAVHELGHGTDFLGRSLEEAVTHSVQREELLSLEALAGRLGRVEPLPDTLRSQILASEPSADDWWWFFGGEVGRVTEPAPWFS